MTTQPRLVAYGIVTPTTTKVCICDDLWRRAIEDQIDSMPEEFDWREGTHYPQVLSEAEMAAELEDLLDGREDEDFVRRGC